MVGLIICGHGSFAAGLLSAVDLMSGEAARFTALDFPRGMSSEDLKDRIAGAAAKANQGDGVVIFTDIAGGSPFKQAALVAAENPSVRVIGGANMPLLLDAVFSQTAELDAFVQEILGLSKNSIKLYTACAKREQKPACEDGI
jgi:PTS system N-acetylgalactosamine-specific IIA component